MALFLAKRLAQVVLAIVGIVTIVFVLQRLTGSPLSVIMPIGATQEDFNRMAELLGLDQPIWVQYWQYVGSVAQGNLGTSSMFAGREALSLAVEFLPNTLLLGGLSLLGAALIGVPLGILSAVFRGGFGDMVSRVIAALGQALPSFWVGVMLIWFFAVSLDWLPASGAGTWQQFIMPAVALGLFPLAAMIRLMRASMLETMAKPYMLLLEAKGLDRFQIIAKHGLKNAAAVPLTYFGITIGQVLTGSVVVETVFSWPGLGRLAVNAIFARDFAIVQAVVFIMAAIFLIVNLVVDLLYGVLDPRVRATAGNKVR